MLQETRKSFEEWKTHLAYMNQFGLCKNCGGSLDYGMGTGKPFEKHHADGDHSNNSVENLELLCKSCHMATLAKIDKDYEKKYNVYLENKRKMFNDIVALVEKTMNKELAGTVITSAIELLNMEDKLNAEINDMNKGIFYPPPSVKAMINYKNMQNEVEAMKEGIKIGLSTIGNLVNKEGK